MFDLLSVDLVELIARILEERCDLLALRCVSRYLYHATHAPFVSAWFNTLTVDFTPRSLQRLANIARRDDLAPAVRCLRVGHCYRSLTVTPSGSIAEIRQARILGEDHSWPRLENGCLDLASQPAAEFMAVLSRFTRCVDICVTDDLSDAPEDSDEEDSEDANATGLSPVDACYIMFSLLDRQKGLRVQGFTIDFYRDQGSWSKKKSQLPPDLVDFLAGSSWSSHLQHLDIRLEIECLTSTTMDLIVSAMSARSMKLSFPNWVGGEAFLGQLAEAAQVPALTELKLHNIRQVSSQTLARAIARFKGSIKSLYMDRVAMSCGELGTLFGQLQSESLPALESVTVETLFKIFFCPLRQNRGLGEQCDGIFEFTQTSFRSKTRVTGVRYRGSGEGMQLVLQALADDSNYYSIRDAVMGRPGLPNTKDNSKNMIGQVVKRFT
jgi:hypothetical protein